MLADTLLIVFVSFCTAFTSEGERTIQSLNTWLNVSCSGCIPTATRSFPRPGVLYLLMYRTENYKRLKAEVEKQSKKCEFVIILKIPI